MVIVATQIKINGIVGFIRFVRMAFKVREQLNKVDGLVFLKFKTFNTLSGWKSDEAMKAFRNSGHHIEAMRNIKKMGKPKSISWEAEHEPDWGEAIEKLQDVPFR